MKFRTVSGNVSAPFYYKRHFTIQIQLLLLYNIDAKKYFEFFIINSLLQVLEFFFLASKNPVMAIDDLQVFFVMTRFNFLINIISFLN